MATVMEICSSALRGVIIAAPGKKLVVADWSNIEGRALAWLAEEHWKVKAYSDYDKGTGSDLYKLTYAKAFGVPVESVDKAQRQIGKVMELAYGYGGGIGAWITFAAAFGIDLEQLAESAVANIPASTHAESVGFYEWYEKQGKPLHGLSKQAFVVCNSFKIMWREEHPRISAYWAELQQAITAAVNNPQVTYICGRHKIRVDGLWLRISVPGGRCLCYPSPRAEDGKITYMGNNQVTRRWERLSTYGGKLCENITQAVSRDVLAEALIRLDSAGYDVVLSVHDEIICETPDNDSYSHENLGAMMEEKPTWATGLPLAQEGFTTYRYCKSD